MAYSDDPYEDETGLAPPPPPTNAALAPAPGMAGGVEGAPMAAAGGRNKGGGAPDTGPSYNWPGLPNFLAPNFARPTMADAQREPGFEFRLNSGRDALERSAAARGVLRSGGTLQNLLEYGQNFGAQEYSNVFNRALQEFDRRYQGAKDTFAPRLAEYQLKGQGELQRAMALYQKQNRGGGGGGSPFIPPDILGPPPAPPDYARMASSGGGSYVAPTPYAAMDDEDPLRY